MNQQFLQSGFGTHVKSIITTLMVLFIIIFILAEPGSSSQKRSFPPWDEGVFAEVANRHGEQASARFRDVYYLIQVHLNDPVETQLEVVNDYMNELPWIADSELWKQPDYWATPFETVTTFGGDCEDIAIAKYAVLRLMGIPDDHLGFAHVLTKEQEHHMVLVYKHPDEVDSYILDNQHPRVAAAKKRADLKAIYAFKNDGTLYVIQDNGNANRKLLA
ncbi:MAG: hypothetical protein D6B25_08850, partial [Desulfobulbaceae bacterium]